MKKKLSVFLSFVMLLSCLCFGSITAQAAEKKTKITYLYEPETQTLYIRGKGAVPAYYLGFGMSVKMMTIMINFLNETRIKAMVTCSMGQGKVTASLYIPRK